MSHSICWLCKAGQSTDEFPFNDVSMGAGWRKTRFKPGEFVRFLKESNIVISPILFSPGFILDYLCIDVLHALDLGVALDALGHFIWELVTSKTGFLEGSTIDK